MGPMRTRWLLVGCGVALVLASLWGSGCDEDVQYEVEEDAGAQDTTIALDLHGPDTSGTEDDTSGAQDDTSVAEDANVSGDATDADDPTSAALFVQEVEGGTLVWPRSKDSLATNNLGALAWETGGDQLVSSQPVWDAASKRYTYPAGLSAADFPAFQWADELVFEGYSDWRLPTLEEIRDLHRFHSDKTEWALGAYWTADEAPYTSDGTEYFGLAWTFDPRDDSFNSYDKGESHYVRVVRDGS